jgi:hypothetical protein
METRLPRIAGEQLNTVWKWMGSATLANAIRSAGEITKGDPAVEGVDRKYWSNAIVLGVPREEVDHETLYLASVTEAPGDAGGDIVSYAKVKQSDLFHGHARNNAGDAVETYSARVRYGAEPARIAFISGDLTGEHPGWSVEPTLVINPSVSLGNATYTQTPVV